MPKQQKDDDLSNRMGGSVRSTFQKVQMTNEIECLYAFFMLLLRYYLYTFYTNYASTKKRCYMVFMLLGLFHDPSKEEDYLINRMGGSFWSTFQKVQRIHEIELFYASFMLSA